MSPGALREASGYTQSELAEHLGVEPAQIARWEWRKDPPESWELICKIAEFYKITPLEAANIFWDKREGDHCPYHEQCNGRTIPPIDLKAKTFDIETSCDICGKTRKHRGKRRTENHYRICHECWCAKVNLGWLEVECRARRLYGHPLSRKCVGKKLIRAPKFGRLLSADVNGSDFSFICRPCSSAISAIRTMDGTVINHLELAREEYKKTEKTSKRFKDLTGFDADQPIPTIETRDEFSRLFRIARSWPLAKFMKPNKESIEFPVGAAVLRSGKSKPQEFHKTSRSIGQLVRRAREVAMVAVLQKKFRQQGVKLSYKVAALIVTNIWKNTGEPVPVQYWKSLDPGLLGGPDHTPQKENGEWWIFHHDPQKLQNLLTQFRGVEEITIKLVKELLGNRLKRAAYTPDIPGYCELCDLILFSENTGVRVHKKCHVPDDFKGGYKSIQPLPTRENESHRHKDLDILRYRYAWAVLKIIAGWEEGLIAKTFDVGESRVEKGIELFRKGLKDLLKADLDRIPERFHPVVSLLVDRRHQRDPKKYWHARGSIDPSFQLPVRRRRRSPILQPSMVS
jgi:transcriptional regulator with XRE-family HTH domain